MKNLACTLCFVRDIITLLTEFIKYLILTSCHTIEEHIFDSANAQFIWSYIQLIQNTWNDYIMSMWIHYCVYLSVWELPKVNKQLLYILANAKYHAKVNMLNMLLLVLQNSISYRQHYSGNRTLYLNVNVTIFNHTP